MKAVIDRSGCIGCGLCPTLCPEVFAMAEDGLLDLVLIRKIGRVAVARVIGGYKKGAHIQNGQVAPPYQNIAMFRRVRRVEVEVLDGRPIVVTEDGECEERMGLSAQVCPLDARVLLPAKN